MSSKGTIETLSKEVSEKEIRQLVKLRVTAGAISVKYKREGDIWILTTEWPELGKE